MLANPDENDPPSPQRPPTAPRLRSQATPPDSPASRTGPPRSLSVSYSLSAPPRGWNDTVHGYFEEKHPPVFQPFGLRGALEYPDSPILRDKKGKQRETQILGDTLRDSPTDEKPGLEWKNEPENHRPQDAKAKSGGDPSGTPDIPVKKTSSMQRAVSDPQPNPPLARSGWGRLRSLLPAIVQQEHRSQHSKHSVVTSSVTINDELMTGRLSALPLRMWFERDEKGHRRIPVLLHRVRLRISDSLNPMHMHKAVFRIECEYANGARWVIYRALRDFLSLHLHYTISTAYHHDVGHNSRIPDFPNTGLPYLMKFMKKGDTYPSQAEFASKQREALEDYLINLIRAVMFSPSANRLATFLELNALFIHLAHSGGTQYKAGYLKIQSVASGDGFGPKHNSRWRRNQERFCAVRDSYLVFLDDPGETSIWDVFLLDQYFEIERPKRYYRQGLNLLRPALLKVKPENEGLVHHEKKNLFQSILDRVSNPKRTSDKPDPFQLVFGYPASPQDASLQTPTPILDPSTNANPAGQPERLGNTDGGALNTIGSFDSASKHTFYIVNSQTRLELRARNERQMLQWITGLKKASAHCHYTGKNRFGSFAPVRLNVAAQWLVDGRDYFWNLSRAILLAKETIYIHDWWLSPELQMRRPEKDHYRLDHLLQQKAEKGVKIYIILYQEVSYKTTPTDSGYAKQKLMSLHPNIMVQRSPSHMQTGTFYWAHHEKLCVIDQTIAFMGGLDVCFGRWDTPQHVLADDGPEPQIWHGKDYSNPRVRDFYELEKPFEEMYDRSKTPRMPWHDVGLQIVGQPARDLARHFIQRWNWLLRIKNHSRRMPCLLPPPEFKDGDLAQNGLTGTCELQICRSAGPWSMGTLDHVETSIQKSYIKAIQKSEHFVYIENQFFITSAIINETRIENKIGDALVDRIIRAHRDKEAWKCCVLIPLLPGFASPLDQGEASALRLILECQNRSISRGPHSIHSRLRKEGIDPNNYISFFSLRNWGRMQDNTLTTEQVYIHSKICIVDDRIVIIGSANINERSLRGDRDSELAAVIRDTDMINGKMAGNPFKVGRFAHSLRVRLMREHLGIDVDALGESVAADSSPQPACEPGVWDPDMEQEDGQEGVVAHVRTSRLKSRAKPIINEMLGQATLGTEEGATSKVLRRLGLGRKNVAPADNMALREERKDFTEKREKVSGFASSVVPTLEEVIVSEENKPQNKSPANHRHGEDNMASSKGQEYNLGKDFVHRQLEQPRDEGRGLGAQANAGEGPKVAERPSNKSLNQTSEPGTRARARSIIRHDLNRGSSKVWGLPTGRPLVDSNCFEDPILDAFWKDTWIASAVHNTEIYRKVFRAVPDDLVTTWKQYKSFGVQSTPMRKPARDPSPNQGSARVSHGEDDPDPDPRCDLRSEEKGTHRSKEPFDVLPNVTSSTATRGSEPFEKASYEEMERLLGEVNGHLVLYPTRFLEGEGTANNFLFNADRLMPLPIYN